MTRSPDSLVPSTSGQLEAEKRDDKALTCRKEGEANLRTATEVNAGTPSSNPPAITPTQLDLFPGRACPLEAKPATDRNAAKVNPDRRDVPCWERQPDPPHSDNHNDCERMVHVAAFTKAPRRGMAGLRWFSRSRRE
jgi:hypothetical protein